MSTQHAYSMSTIISNTRVESMVASLPPLMYHLYVSSTMVQDSPHFWKVYIVHRNVWGPHIVPIAPTFGWTVYQVIGFILRMPFPTKFSSPKFSPMNHFKGQQGGHFWVYSNRSSSSRPGKFRSRTDHLTLCDQVINLLTSIPNIVIIHFLHD